MKRFQEPPGASSKKKYCIRDDQEKKPKDEDEDEVMEEEEDEDEEEDEEEIAGIRYRAYSELLPEIKSILGDDKPDLLTDRTPRRCLVCPTMQNFTGWRALMAHAKTIMNKRVQRHRGYHQALDEVLKAQALEAPRRDLNQIRVKQPVARVEKGVVIPPMVVVERAASVEEVSGHLEVIDRASVERVVKVAAAAVVVVVFKVHAAEHASYLVKFFEDDKRGRGSGFEGMIGYAAEPQDMEKLDPRRELGWAVGSLKSLQDYAQKAKEQDQAKIAVLKENERSSKLEEGKKAVQENMNVVEQQFAEKQSEIEALQNENETAANRYEEWCEREQQNFNRELRDMEAHHEKTWKQLNMELDFNYRKTERQRLDRLDQLALLKKVLSSGTEQAKANSRKLLALEEEKENFERGLKECEDKLNSHFQALELQLVDEYEKEITVLSERYAVEKEECLQKKECAICFEELGDKELARCVFNPCGHATVCMTCAKPMNECPICRTKITSKLPLATDQPFFG